MRIEPGARIEQRFAAIADGEPPRPDEWAAQGLDPRQQASLLLLADVARAFREGGQSDARPRSLHFRWGPLEVGELLGRGSFGSVYRAFDPWLSRDVALKLFDDEAAGSSAMQEARALARVRHRNVLLIHGCAVHDERAGLWSEVIEGQTLADALRSGGAMSVIEALRIAADLAAALAAIHRAGLVHGDVKPENIMREAGGRIVLMDFGAGGEQRTLDARIATIGTQRYVPPAVLEGGPVGPASDLYALSITLQDLLGARRDSPRQTRAAMTDDGWRTGLPAATARRIEALLPGNMAGFPATALELQRELAAILDLAALRRTPRPLRKRWLAGTAAALLPLAWLAWSTQGAGRWDMQAQMLRLDNDGARILAPDDQVQLGDRLRLSLSSTRPVWIYVLNEDASGIATVLYPAAPDALPIAADAPVQIPSDASGALAWQVSVAAEHEEFLVIAALRTLPALDRTLADWHAVGTRRAAGTVVPATDVPLVSGAALDEALREARRDPAASVRVWRWKLVHRR